MINHVIRSAISRNTQAFSFIKHVGESRGLLEHKVVPSFLVRSNDIDVNGFKGHELLAPFNAGRQITGSTPLVEENSEVKLVWYYNCALGRPNKKTFIAPSQSEHGSTLIVARLSSFPALHHNFQGGVRAFSSRPTLRKDTEFINNKPLRQFTLSKGKSAGRNSAGRITIFHRGGGAKRLQRIVDLKRSTSSMGIVERIEYDPNRSSRIALVRWEKGVQLNSQSKYKTIEDFAPSPRKIHEPTTTTNLGPFSFSSMPGKVDQRKVACFSPRQMRTCVTVGLPTSKSPFTSKVGGSRKSSAKDIFFSTLSSPNATGVSAFFSLDSSFSFPRMAVAGAKPAFFAPRMKETVEGEKSSSPGEIRKLTTRSFLGVHRIKRKAAVSWQSLGVTKHNESKLKMDQVSLPAKPIGDRAPLTYILASHRLEAGSMVMNCDQSLRP